MKRLIALLVLLIPMVLIAQNIGFVNTETILSKMPNYIQAQQQLERLKQQYELQLEKELNSIEELFNRYQEQKRDLSAVQREAREREIISKERSLKEREQEIFGQEGIMAKRSQELLDPIKQTVQNVIDRAAQERGYVMIFDLSMTQGVIYKNNKADITPYVLARMGLTQ